jgi:hypothetical protein
VQWKESKKHCFHEWGRKKSRVAKATSETTPASNVITVHSNVKDAQLYGVPHGILQVSINILYKNVFQNPEIFLTQVSLSSKQSTLLPWPAYCSSQRGLLRAKLSTWPQLMVGSLKTFLQELKLARMIILVALILRVQNLVM